jgi:predicted GH43/DUF377 family glycosyl hydrolase
MLRFVKSKADKLKKEDTDRKNEELKLTTIDKTEDLPPSFYRLPDEGTLICVGDVKDLQYINLHDLIDPNVNIYYYNSCICNYKDQYRLFYRCGKNPKTCEDRIATCLLTKDLQVVPNTNKYVNVFSNWQSSRNAGPDTLNRHIRYIYENNEQKSFVYKNGCHVEDPRVVEFQGHWFMLYTDGLTVGVAKLDLETCDIVYSHFLNVPPKHIISDQSDGREKNWIPIVSNNQLYILYSDTPRTFIHCKDKLTHLSVEKHDKLNYNVSWNYGDVRGGCPPIEYDKDSLIWFFHSAKNVHYSMPTMGVRTYFIGAYVTTKIYPFELKQITIFPIFFGTLSPLRKEVSYQSNVVFPCGAVKEDDTFIISMGINDYCIGHLKVFRKDIIWKSFEKRYTHLSILK